MYACPPPSARRHQDACHVCRYVSWHVKTSICNQIRVTSVVLCPHFFIPVRCMYECAFSACLFGAVGSEVHFGKPDSNPSSTACHDNMCRPTDQPRNASYHDNVVNTVRISKPFVATLNLKPLDQLSTVRESVSTTHPPCWRKTTWTSWVSQSTPLAETTQRFVRLIVQCAILSSLSSCVVHNASLSLAVSCRFGRDGFPNLFALSF